MSDSRNSLLAIVPLLIMSFGLAACSSEPQANAGEASEPSLAATPGEHAATESAGVEDSRDGGRFEGEGEHGERGEGREGSEHRESGEAGEHDEGEERGERDEGGEGEGEGEGEESGVYVGRGDVWDAIRRGARLVLAFDPVSNAFTGRVENMTDSMLCAVRVEVHLSNGTELGPTERTDLPAGQSIEVQLPTGGDRFDTWTAHPEISRCSGA